MSAFLGICNLIPFPLSNRELEIETALLLEIASPLFGGHVISPAHELECDAW